MVSAAHDHGSGRRRLGAGLRARCGHKPRQRAPETARKQALRGARGERCLKVTTIAGQPIPGGQQPGGGLRW